MNRDKQIEEIQDTLIRIADEPCMIDGLQHWSDVIAEKLYNAGYRKASDVAREIFENILNALKYTRFASPLEKAGTLEYIFALKKEYEEKEK
jgi:hypothetical protein